MHEAAPVSFDAEVQEQTKNIIQLERSEAPAIHNVGHQEKLFNFHHMHNQSQVR